MNDAVDRKPISLRLPPSLRAIVARQAKENRRSLNSQIIVMIESDLRSNEKAEAAVDAATPA